MPNNSVSRFGFFKVKNLEFIKETKGILKAKLVKKNIRS
jgi:hypothetical protein